MARTIVITGASDGVGAAAARELASQGHHIAVVGRNPERTRRVAEEVHGEAFLADFSRLTEVRRLAQQLRDRYERIDVLANNAGGIFGERIVTEDGHELTLQVNYLAPFLLTNLLLDRLIESRASVISTSSVASTGGHIDLRNLELERRWGKWPAYCNAKLLNVLFTRGLHRACVLDGVSAAAFHPGVVASSFAHQSRGLTSKLWTSALGRRFMVSPAQGADQLVWLATGTPPRDWASGQYYVKRRARVPNRQVRDDRLVDDLWKATAAMVA
ncbi:SDR family NAD(P)-dependent oxidoreductase [Nigerium massiliense]|uniref:SDR family NAD(P)-dependent oxidoreductase n=1 Tax=Nigerium massiliense TaxID=1522317 RepID=UPI00058CDFE4|nr:SDR family NAD(P)-dependent oxidoreductase [Nigerium massiliense]